MTDKQYEGSVYITAVGSEMEYGPCHDSIEQIQRRDGDSGPHFNRATKGYEARQTHINNWYHNTEHPFILMLDADMLFPPDALERLRAHKLPFVSGFYMRRTIRPVYPVWFERGQPGVMPMKPLMAVPEKDKLYPIGASGWGCILMHRDVITETRKLLKGEPDIIEDDMDVYPYDLRRALDAISALDNGIGDMTMSEARKQVDILKEEIRPLRGVKDTVGSDIRFPFFAQLAGFPLFGDTGVQCQHVTTYPVGLDDWLNQPAYNVRDLSLYINQEDAKERERLRKAVA